MRHSQLGLHHVKSVTTKVTRFEEKGFSTLNIVVTDDEGNEFDICLFTDTTECLRIVDAV